MFFTSAACSPLPSVRKARERTFRTEDFRSGNRCSTRSRTQVEQGGTAPVTNVGLPQLAFLATAALFLRHSCTYSTATVHITEKTAQLETLAHSVTRVCSSQVASAQITKEHLCSDLLGTSANGTARPCFTCFCFWRRTDKRALSWCADALRHAAGE